MSKTITLTVDEARVCYDAAAIGLARTHPSLAATLGACDCMMCKAYRILRDKIAEAEEEEEG